MDILFTIFFFIIGIMFGSFFNVVGLRLPKGETFTNDRSYCPSCKKQLKWYELVPVFSFFLQIGKCRNCKTKISFIYPAVELLTGFLFVYSYSKIGLEAELITAMLLVSMLMIILVSDISYMIIPNKVLLFFLPLFIIMRIIEPLNPWWSSITGGLTGFIIIALIILLSKGGMGGGDLKLFAVLGIVIGLGNIFVTFFVACLLGAIVGIILIAMKVIKRRQPVPFGPYIVIAALIAYFYGESLIHWYIGLL